MSFSSQIPFFLINLDRSPDRLAAFGEQMEKLGLAFERVKAVDGSNIPDEEVQRLYEKQSQWFPWDKGAMGCFLSHRKVWSIIVNRGLDWSFIAEDDLHIAKAAPFFTEYSWIPYDADVVKAETFRERVLMSQGLPQKVDGHDLRRLKSSHIGAGGYFLTASTARFLLDETESICDPTDHVLFDPLLGLFQKMTVYQIDPAICVQDFLLQNTRREMGFVSTLQGERNNWAGAPQNLSPKPRGWAKVWREISRPFKRFGKRISDSWKNLHDKTVAKFVPYIGDRRWYQANRK